MARTRATIVPLAGEEDADAPGGSNAEMLSEILLMVSGSVIVVALLPTLVAVLTQTNELT
jgi:hypothetical protein